MDIPMLNTTTDHTEVAATRRPRPMLAVIATVFLGLALMACTGSGDATSNHAAINRVRANVGLPELSRVAELDAKAQAQADRMSRRGGIFHSKSLASGVSAGWTNIGENVAMAGSIDQAQAALEASPGHYANMVNGAYNQVGIGVVVRNGIVYVAQVFVSR